MLGGVAGADVGVVGACKALVLGEAKEERAKVLAELCGHHAVLERVAGGGGEQIKEGAEQPGVVRGEVGEKVVKGGVGVVGSALLVAPCVVGFEVEEAALVDVDHLLAHLALLLAWHRDGHGQHAAHARKGPLYEGGEVVRIGVANLVEEGGGSARCKGCVVAKRRMREATLVGERSSAMEEKMSGLSRPRLRICSPHASRSASTRAASSWMCHPSVA